MLTFRSLLRILSPPSLLLRELRLSSTASKRRSTNPPAESSRKGRSWSLKTEMLRLVVSVKIKTFQSFRKNRITRVLPTRLLNTKPQLNCLMKVGFDSLFSKTPFLYMHVLKTISRELNQTYHEC